MDVELFKDKLALITGGGSGIGKEVAFKFHELGCKLIVLDLNIGGIVKSKLKSEEHMLCEVDITNEKSMSELATEIKGKFGAIDYAFNAAGIGGKFSNIENYPIDNWRKVMETNLTGTFLSMKLEVTLMKNQENAVIINCGSIFSTECFPNDSAYVASKHAVAGLTKCAALEYASEGIRINMISPGFTATAMTNNYSPEQKQNLSSKHALKRFASTEEIANGVIWLCSKDSSFVCGHNLLIDGGYSIM